MTWDDPFNALLEKLVSWGQQAILALPNVVAAGMILGIFWFVARALRTAVSRLLATASAPPQIQRLLATMTGFVVVMAGVFVALGILELDKALASLLAGAGILGLALGFAFQDIASNFMAGILISIRRPFRIGDLIETNGFFGTVERVELRATIVRLPPGQLVRVPNKDVFANPIINYSETGERRVDLGVGVSYGDDLDQAERLALKAVEGVEQRAAEREPELFYEAFGDSSVNFIVRFWLGSTRQRDYLAARSEAIKRIKKAYAENGITIPFPVRTLDFGIVGGEKLADALPRELFVNARAS